MPGVTGLEILNAATSECLRARVILLSDSAGDSELVTAAAWGAHGVITLDVTPEMLIQYLRQVALGQLLPLAFLAPEQRPDKRRGTRTLLTDRERDIIQLVSEGLLNKEVGRRLDLSEGTIKVHLHRIYRTLAINNRTALAVSTVFRHSKNWLFSRSDL
jgi:two-component system nitrate/nitrite response regulator NarL